MTSSGAMTIQQQRELVGPTYARIRQTPGLAEAIDEVIFDPEFREVLDDYLQAIVGELLAPSTFFSSELTGRTIAMLEHSLWKDEACWRQLRLPVADKGRSGVWQVSHVVLAAAAVVHLTRDVPDRLSKLEKVAGRSYDFQPPNNSEER